MILGRFGRVSAVSVTSDASGGDVFEEITLGPCLIILNSP